MIVGASPKLIKDPEGDDDDDDWGVENSTSQIMRKVHVIVTGTYEKIVVLATLAIMKLTQIKNEKKISLTLFHFIRSFHCYFQ